MSKFRIMKKQNSNQKTGIHQSKGINDSLNKQKRPLKEEEAQKSKLQGRKKSGQFSNDCHYHFLYHSNHYQIVNQLILLYYISPMNFSLNKKLLGFAIRKDISRKNKKINHKQFTRSMYSTQKIKYLITYHKKKNIALVLAGIIIYTYDLQKPIYRKIVQLQSPITWLLSWFIEQIKVQPTITQQKYLGDLNQMTVSTLIKLYYQADREYYYGVGRTLLFSVYTDLGLIQTEEQKKKFWLGSGFYKQRNQKAAGVNLTQFLTVFEESLAHIRKTNPEITESSFLDKFIKSFINKAPEVRKWEVQFNHQRNQQYIKNMPGDGMKKQELILDLVKETSREKQEPLSIDELEKQIIRMGLKGLNLADKYLYWQLLRIWQMLKCHNYYKKIKHPLSTELERISFDEKLSQAYKRFEEMEANIQELQAQFKKSYKQEII